MVSALDDGMIERNDKEDLEHATDTGLDLVQLQCRAISAVSTLISFPKVENMPALFLSVNDSMLLACSCVAYSN